PRYGVSATAGRSRRRSPPATTGPGRGPGRGPMTPRLWGGRPRRSPGTPRRARRISIRTIEARCEPRLRQHPQTLRPRSSVPPDQSHQLALDLHAIGRQDADLVGGVGRLERNGGAAPSEALERRLLIVDHGNDDIAGIGGLGLLDQGGVAVEDAGVDHRVAPGLKRKMIARTQPFPRHRYHVGPFLHPPHPAAPPHPPPPPPPPPPP